MFRRLWKNQRGQFVMLMAIVMGLIVISLAFSATQLGTFQQNFRYEPAKETVTEITSDLDRALTHALSVASKTYNTTGRHALTQAEHTGLAYVLQWHRAAVSSHSNLGLQMSIQPPTNATGGPTDVSFLFDWSNNRGISQASTQFSLNVTNYGLTGWVGGDRVARVLDIDIQSFDSNFFTGTTSFNFTLTKENGAPVNNLGARDLTVRMNPLGSDWEKATVKNLQYLGGGKYFAELSPYFPLQWLAKNVTVITPQDQIYVAAYISPLPLAQVTLDSRITTGQESQSHRGIIKFGGVPYGNLPPPNIGLPVNVTVVPPLTETVEFVPKETDVFKYWELEGDVELVYGNLTANPIIVKVQGDAKLTAYYDQGSDTPPPPPPRRPAKVYFDSADVNQTNNHLGIITVQNSTRTLNMTSLPYSATLSTGDYTIKYRVAAGYTFLGWEVNNFSKVQLINPSSPTTTLRVLDDGGKVAAIYYRLTPGPVGDSYIAVYVAPGYGLSLTLPSTSGFLPSHSSHGKDKQVIDLYMTLPSDVELRFDGPSQYWISVSEPNSARFTNITIEYMQLGAQDFTLVARDGVPISKLGANAPILYNLFADHNSINPISPMWIPAKSTIHIQVSVQFYKPPFGVIHLYYGPGNASLVFVSTRTPT